MVLLTQSQVSVLISGTISLFSPCAVGTFPWSSHPLMSPNILLSFISCVSLFTFALFLSGYVLQQRTVTDIRAAIRPSVQNFAQNLESAPANNLRPLLTNQQGGGGVGGEQVKIESDNGPAGAGEGKDEEHKGDFLAEYYDKDAERQLSHEKLPYILDSSTFPPPPLSDGQISAKLSHIAHLQEQSYATAAGWLQKIDSTIHRWIRTIRSQPLEDWELAPDWDESTPIEELSAQQRRRRIKMDIRRLGVVEDGELRAVYRPRKRTGKAL